MVSACGLLVSVLFKQLSSSSINKSCCSVCVCVHRYTSIHPLLYYISYSIHLPLPPTCRPSQPGMKTAWHLTKEINHPWPWTNYHSLPTLCLPLRGEHCNNSATWKTAASLDRALMDTPVWPRLLRSPGWLTFKSLSLSKSTHTKEAIVRDQGPWPLEMESLPAMRGKSQRGMIWGFGRSGNCRITLSSVCYWHLLIIIP